MQCSINCTRKSALRTANHALRVAYHHRFLSTSKTINYFKPIKVIRFSAWGEGIHILLAAEQTMGINGKQIRLPPPLEKDNSAVNIQPEKMLLFSLGEKKSCRITGAQGDAKCKIHINNPRQLTDTKTKARNISCFLKQNTVQ